MFIVMAKEKFHSVTLKVKARETQVYILHMFANGDVKIYICYTQRVIPASLKSMYSSRVRLWHGCQLISRLQFLFLSSLFFSRSLHIPVQLLFINDSHKHNDGMLKYESFWPNLFPSQNYRMWGYSTSDSVILHSKQYSAIQGPKAFYVSLNLCIFSYVNSYIPFKDAHSCGSIISIGW